MNSRVAQLELKYLLKFLAYERISSIFPSRKCFRQNQREIYTSDLIEKLFHPRHRQEKYQ